jgi:hypothetical protein
MGTRNTNLALSAKTVRSISTSRGRNVSAVSISGG